MPHKHKRKGGDQSSFDLPPSQKAWPLSTRPSKVGTAQETLTSQKKRKSRSGDNDMPRAFKRIMAAAKGGRLKSGLDNGETGKAAPNTQGDNIITPSILPGEKFGSFAARVDASFPLSGLSCKTKRKDGKDTLGFKVYQTRKERKMHKLYDQWRAEDRKIREKREEELEAAAEDKEDYNIGASAWQSGHMMDTANRQSTKKKARHRNGDEDPWLELKLRRSETRVGLHDVALEPPQLHKSMSQPLKIRGATVNVEDVPKSAGSLRRREELQTVRRDIVDAYRKIRDYEQSKLDR